MLPATVNRTLNAACAAFALAGILDPRVSANTRAWKVGLGELPNGVTARDAVLTDKQMRAVVAAASEISEAFGIHVLVHAKTGSRSSQLARCLVGGRHRDKLIIPASRKGGNGGCGGQVGIPLRLAWRRDCAGVLLGRT